MWEWLATPYCADVANHAVANGTVLTAFVAPMIFGCIIGCAASTIIGRKS